MSMQINRAQSRNGYIHVVKVLLIVKNMARKYLGHNLNKLVRGSLGDAKYQII